MAESGSSASLAEEHAGDAKGSRAVEGSGHNNGGTARGIGRLRKRRRRRRCYRLEEEVDREEGTSWTSDDRNYRWTTNKVNYVSEVGPVVVYSFGCSHSPSIWSPTRAPNPLFPVPAPLPLRSISLLGRATAARRRMSTMLRELRLSLNQTQRVRLQSALQRLQDMASLASAVTVVADTVPVNHEDSILKCRSSVFIIRLPPISWLLLNCVMVRGHGTSDLNGEVVAALCGVVERVNKLVYVRSQRARY
ncbi:hypothetical protein GW17_00037107 [Ensete ventricosum]|nr:hypothetical protein GW17_00037107 [Ensete ventricosum]